MTATVLLMLYLFASICAGGAAAFMAFLLYAEGHRPSVIAISAGGTFVASMTLCGSVIQTISGWAA